MTCHPFATVLSFFSALLFPHCSTVSFFSSRRLYLFLRRSSELIRTGDDSRRHGERGAGRGRAHHVQTAEEIATGEETLENVLVGRGWLEAVTGTWTDGQECRKIVKERGKKKTTLKKTENDRKIKLEKGDFF